MPETIKVLGQAVTNGGALVDLYTVPAATSSVISSVVVCNRSTASRTFRLSVAPAGAADTATQYLYFDTALPANDTFAATVGGTLAATDKVRVSGSSLDVTFTAFGTEIT